MSRRVTYFNSSRISFRPINLAGSQLYFAKNTATPSLWNDQSPNGYDLSQAVAIQQPTIGTDTVDFDGVNDVLIRNGSFFNSDDRGVIFFSFIWDGVNPVNPFSSARTTTNQDLFRISIGSVLQLWYNTGGVNNFLNSNNLSGILNVGYNYGYLMSDSVNYFANINGVDLTWDSGANNGRWFNLNTGRQNLSLSAVIRATAFTYFASKINKIYYNNTALSPSDMAKLETFFSDPNKY
jgi:hypothetical protein